VDRDNTKRTVLTLNKTVEILPDSGAAIVIGENDVPMGAASFEKNMPLYLSILGAGVIIAGAIIITNRKKKATPILAAESSPATQQNPSDDPNDNMQP